MLKRFARYLIYPAKSIPKALIRQFLRACKLELLTKEQTNSYLSPYRVAKSPEKQIFLPGIQNEADLSMLLFAARQAVTHPGYVWRFKRHAKKATQLSYGGICTENKILCIDFDSYHLIRNFVQARKRTSLSCKLMIAPWSHYIDGIAFGGYYDFVILIAAKLCRIKQFMPEQEFVGAIVSYPLFRTTYESDYLALIGVKPDHVVDSRLYDVQFEQSFLANSGHWFYPDPADIFALKRYVETTLKPRRTARNRIYVSRSSRRKVVNEQALLTLLKKYDFTIIDDRPRTVAEQVAIYKNASFILGPHGASFTNIIWCEPGTHLFELFPPNLLVDHFSYLASVMEMEYSAYCHVIKMGQAKHQVEEDIFVSIIDLEKSLDRLLVPVNG